MGNVLSTTKTAIKNRFVIILKIVQMAKNLGGMKAESGNKKENIFQMK
jgi:hypothetical protein